MKRASIADGMRMRGAMLVLVTLLLGACSNDYDRFKFIKMPGTENPNPPFKPPPETPDAGRDTAVPMPPVDSGMDEDTGVEAPDAGAEGDDAGSGDDAGA